LRSFWLATAKSNGACIPRLSGRPREFTVQDAESIFTFVLAVAAVMAERARQSERQAAETKGTSAPKSTGSKARGAVRAVSKRTGVSVDDILGRQRINVIASARHEAIWRVRQVTEWSLPRVGHFFVQRDHTTVLHSIRRMEDRAARDPDLRAYMAGIERAWFSPAAFSHPIRPPIVTTRRRGQWPRASCPLRRAER
jgi:Bacterial dnaA protein helix-turn-helix